jgi:hypothetical protein
MKATADTIWRVPAYLPYLQPPLTDEAVASAERAIGYKLPAEYLGILNKQNGGYIRFTLPGMAHNTIAGIGPHYPSVTAFDWDDCREYVSFPLDGLIPFDGDGHWHICLDFRRNPAAPAIALVDIELNRQSHIADSFAAYLAMLQVAVGDEYVLESALDIEAVKSRLSEALPAHFEPPDSWAHGYPILRAGLGSRECPEWIWISPNAVPRGFVRRDDARYAELKDLMPGHAARFPWVPERCYVLSTTEGVRSQVLGACEQSGITIRPLREYLPSR